MSGRIGVTLALVAGLGCGRGQAAPIEEDTFVEVMVELRRAVGDSALDPDFQARRASILQQQGVTEADLEAYLRWAGRDPERLRRTFERITEQLRQPEEE